MKADLASWSQRQAERDSSSLFAKIFEYRGFLNAPSPLIAEGDPHEFGAERAGIAASGAGDRHMALFPHIGPSRTSMN